VKVRIRYVAVVGLAICILGVAACGGSSSSKNAGSAAPPIRETAVAGATVVRATVAAGSTVVGGTVTAGSTAVSGTASAAATSDLCLNLTTLKNDVQSLLSAVTTLDRSNINEAAKKVESDFNSVRNSRQELKASNRDQIANAFNDVKNAIGNVGQGSGAIAVVTAIRTSINTLVNAIADAISQYICG
jgi:hypothetical protein